MKLSRPMLPMFYVQFIGLTLIGLCLCWLGQSECVATTLLQGSLRSSIREHPTPAPETANVRKPANATPYPLSSKCPAKLLPKPCWRASRCPAGSANIPLASGLTKFGSPQSLFGSKYHYSRYIVGIWTPKVYTILLLGPFGKVCLGPETVKPANPEASGKKPSS